MMHICVTRLQWIKGSISHKIIYAHVFVVVWCVLVITPVPEWIYVIHYKKFSWLLHHRLWDSQRIVPEPEKTWSIWVKSRGIHAQEAQQKQTMQIQHSDGLVQDCSIYSASAMEILLSCTKPLICQCSYDLSKRILMTWCLFGTKPMLIFCKNLHRNWNKCLCVSKMVL